MVLVGHSYGGIVITEAGNDPKVSNLDIAFSHAGLMPASDVATLKVSEWQRMVDVNVKGVLNTTACMLPDMIRQRSGHIINTSPIAGRKVFPGLAAIVPPSTQLQLCRKGCAASRPGSTISG